MLAKEYIFKEANYPHEFEQIHRLNYLTFVEEIPQHEANEQQSLIDPFHSENTYLICLKDEDVIGMVAVRDNRPFSIDRKLGPIEEHLSFNICNPCEIRLLSVQKEYRNGRALLGLIRLLSDYCLRKGYDIGVISGTTRQLKLYQQLGFKAFGEVVGTKDTLYQPMFLTKADFLKTCERTQGGTISFLPGPIQISTSVQKALGSLPISHRSGEYSRNIEGVKSKLKQLTNSKYVQLLFGSGTLANDVIAAQLSELKGKGLILVNGEFGERLVKHAKRFQLDFEVIKDENGKIFSEQELIVSKEIKWLWAVHIETSTGVVNPLILLKSIAKKYQLKLCLDCISSLGSMPLDLDGVYLASGVSGKGLGSFTGIAFVFHQHMVESSERIPLYLDLGTYVENNSIPFSQSSNLLYALKEALKFEPDKRYQKVQEIYQLVKGHLHQIGIGILAPLTQEVSSIITLKIEKPLDSGRLGDMMKNQGYYFHYESDYLRKRNWIQIACMAEIDEGRLKQMLELFTAIFQYDRKYSIH